MLIIRKYHPTLNLLPENEEEFRVGLAYFTYSSYTWYQLPASLNYRKIEFKGINDDFKLDAICIETTCNKIIETNIGELGKTLFNTQTYSEKELEDAFLGLENKLTSQFSKHLPQIIHSCALGEVKKDASLDFYKKEDIRIPFFDDELMAVTYLDIESGSDSEVKSYDKALENFLAIKIVVKD